MSCPTINSWYYEVWIKGYWALLFYIKMLSITLLICANVAAPAMAVEAVVAIRNSKQLFMLSYSHLQDSSIFLRSRRQTSEADMSECRAIAARAICSSSYAQNFINTNKTNIIYKYIISFWFFNPSFWFLN